MFAAIAAAFTIIFLALKVGGSIDWSWWVVFSPMLVFGALALIGAVQMYQHQRAHLKQARVLIEQIQQAGGSPLDRLTEMLSKLGDDATPPGPPAA